MKLRNRLFPSSIRHPLVSVANRLCAVMVTLLVLAGLGHSAYGVGVSEYCSADVPKTIPDEGTARSELEISDTGPIIDLDVKINIRHEYDSNLEVYLVGPDGTRVELFSNVGSYNENFTNTILDDEASVSITAGSAPFTGSFRPEGRLSNFDGKDISGTWILEVTDKWEDDIGRVESWCLLVTQEAAESLPAPVIQTQSKTPGGIRDTVVWNDVGEITELAASGLPVSIPDNAKRTSELTVRGIGMIEDLNVKLNISHNRASDLDVFLIAPDGTRVELFTDVGASQSNFEDTILDDEAATSIKNGSAPFTGSYKPEGKLSNLRGKDIHGVWTLEVTDDSSSTSGTLNSWSLIADLADIFYCAQCATDKNFNSISDESGWIMDTSHTFTGLDPDRQYWYRVKARPMDAWLQTTKADFDADVLSNVKTTTDGEVVLDGGGAGQELYLIGNPSFETPTVWLAGSNNLMLFLFGMGIASGDIWVSDGRYVGAMIFEEDFFYASGDRGYFLQRQIDWTGVSTLVFDYCSVWADRLTASVLIGDTVVWSTKLNSSSMNDHYDETIDVSAITGRRDLKLQVEVDRSGAFLAGMFWDNLRTYGPSGEPAGNIISTPVAIGANDKWDVLVLDGSTPADTKLTVDILPASGSNPIGSWRQMSSSNDAPSVFDISGLTTKTIRLRGNLETENLAATPTLHSWLLTCALAARESDWSNVESSQGE